MAKKLDLSEKQIVQIEDFLQTRLQELKDLRQNIDDDMKEEVELYNDYDKYMQTWNETEKVGKKWWEEKRTIPYIYTIVQTMVARLIQIFYGKLNYLKIYVEDPVFKAQTGFEKTLQRWVQQELDKGKLKEQARDVFESALVKRTAWIEVQPFIENGKMTKVNINPLDFYDVWFDTRVKKIEDSDFFVRKIVKMYKVEQNEIYFNLDVVKESTAPADHDLRDTQQYEAKHGKKTITLYYDPVKNNVTDEVVIHEYHGVWDISKKKSKPKYKEIIFTYANEKVLIGAQINDLKTHRKILIFPIRPIRQADSLIGKSVPSVTKDLQYLLNEIMAYTVQNFKTLIKLLFKYKKESGIDFDELWAGAGNAVGYEDAPTDVDVFPVPQMVQIGLAMLAQVLQLMQQTTGAVDYVMGTSAGRGITETATGIKTITEQAMFKFQMMAENCYADVRELINFIIILWSKYNPKAVYENYPDLKKFMEQTEKQLEDSLVIDIGLNDLSLRRDVERTGFINGINVIAGMVEKVQGDTRGLLREVMEKLEMENIDVILKEAKNPAELREMMMQELLAKAQGAENQKRGGSNKANPQAENAALPEEEANATTPTAAVGG
jgi:hypothetical protein